jgi:fructose-1,6-bisphosphatase/inositol monophosphatase family enzyme
MQKLQILHQAIRKLHEKIRNDVIYTCENRPLEALSRIDHEAEEDTIYAIDRISDTQLIDFFESEIAQHLPVTLIAEGIPGGRAVLPAGISEEKTEYYIIIDPIDGTREIMYQKRSAWILTGVAPNKNRTPTLQDIEFAIQTEIPLVKQHLSEIIWAFKGKGVNAERYDRLTKAYLPLTLNPSQSKTIAHGFAMIARLFPGAREILAEIDEEIVRNILGDVKAGKTHCFEDQYLSTGGQIYELISGHDRFIADLRPLMDTILQKRGLSLGICCHPYDICTELIAQESGVIITDPLGNPLHTKLSVTDDVAWVGYANANIRAQVEPHLQEALKKRRLI